MALRIVNELPTDENALLLNYVDSPENFAGSQPVAALISDEVKLSQIKGLYNNMYKKMYIDEHGTGNHRKLDDQNDTRAIYFSKQSVDDLFALNPGSDGLRIYLGLHDNGILPNRDPEHYNNKMMVVLVTTTKEIDNLKLNDSVEIAGSVLPPARPGGGEAGMDNGTLCPPDPHCN